MLKGTTKKRTWNSYFERCFTVFGGLLLGDKRSSSISVVHDDFRCEVMVVHYDVSARDIWRFGYCRRCSCLMTMSIVDVSCWLVTLRYKKAMLVIEPTKDALFGLTATFDNFIDPTEKNAFGWSTSIWDLGYFGGVRSFRMKIDALRFRRFKTLLGEMRCSSVLMVQHAFG